MLVYLRNGNEVLGYGEMQTDGQLYITAHQETIHTDIYFSEAVWAMMETVHQKETTISDNSVPEEEAEYSTTDGESQKQCTKDDTDL